MSRFIDEYEYPATAQPDGGFDPAELRKRANKPRRAKARGANKAVSREDMFKVMSKISEVGNQRTKEQLWSRLESFVSDYSFPESQSAAAHAAEPLQQSTSETEADADCVFAAMDLDGDGEISRAELSAHLKTAGYSQFAANNILDLCFEAEGVTRVCLRDRFARFETLRQAPGLINGNEVSERAATNIRVSAEQLFDQIRRQGESTFRQAELLAHLAGSAYSEKAVCNIFEAIDADRNGQISREELTGSLTRYSALRLALGIGQDCDRAPTSEAFVYLW